MLSYNKLKGSYRFIAAVRSVYEYAFDHATSKDGNCYASSPVHLLNLN